MRLKMTSSGNDEKRECPLCMEMIDFDDLNFYPCQCRYQVCRFCWYRLINEENGLCPNCRKRYNSEEPALFKPATEEEVARRKRDRKLQEQQKKRRTADNRKHLADVRVLQKNLVFVMNLPLRLNDKEILKGNEYFGKYGKVFKVILNKNVSPNNMNQPTISAYVTYLKMEDALRAVVELNRLHIDGRHLKASLGTTKYCTQFLKSLQCTKHECMYLHEMGDDAASFTKEEMTLGKHTEYELKLIEHFQSSQPTQSVSESSSQSDKTDVLKSSDNNEPPRTNRTPQHMNSMGSSPSPVNSPAVSGGSTPISSQILNSAIHFPPPTTTNSNNVISNTCNPVTIGGTPVGSISQARTNSASQLLIDSPFPCSGNSSSLDNGNTSLLTSTENGVIGFDSTQPTSLLFSLPTEDSIISMNNRTTSSKDDAPALDFDPVREAQEGLALEMETEGKLRCQQVIQHQEFLDQQLSKSMSSFWSPAGGLSGRSSSTSYMSPCSPLPPHSPAVGISPSRGGPVNNPLFTPNAPSMSPLSSHNFDMTNLQGSLPQSPPIHSQLIGGGARSSLQGNNSLMQSQRINNYTNQLVNSSSLLSQNINMQRSALSHQNQMTFGINNTNKSSGLNWAFVPPPSSKDPSCTIDFEASRYFSPTMQDNLQSPGSGAAGFSNSMQQRSNFSGLFPQNGNEFMRYGDVYDPEQQASNSYFGSPTPQTRPQFNHLSTAKNQFNGSIHESPMPSSSIWNIGGHMENGAFPSSPHAMPSSHNFSNSSSHNVMGNAMAFRDNSLNGYGNDQNSFLPSQFCNNDDIGQHIDHQNYNIPGSVRPLANMVMSDSNSSNYRVFPSKY